MTKVNYRIYILILEELNSIIQCAREPVLIPFHYHVLN